jgi:CHASE3 domain sensor protein
MPFYAKFLLGFLLAKLELLIVVFALLTGCQQSGQLTDKIFSPADFFILFGLH